MHVSIVKKILQTITQTLILANFIYHIFYFVGQGHTLSDFCIINPDGV